MIELKHDALQFSFPEVHPDAMLTIEFQRTFRIPDDDRDYPLPPGLGRFPLRHVDDFANSVPAQCSPAYMPTNAFSPRMWDSGTGVRSNSPCFAWVSSLMVWGPPSSLLLIEQT